MDLRIVKAPLRQTTDAHFIYVPTKHGVRLGGAIHKLDDGRYKIEFLMEFIHHEPTLDKASAWVHGVAATRTV